MHVYIGTSGFSYDHWNTIFYPKDVHAKRRLNYYANVFSTVEINNTFYHLPKEETVNNWYNQVPDDFVFALKASRYITHQKRLLDYAKTVPPFLEKISHFKFKCGPVLFQLPPNFKRDDTRLYDFIHFLPKKYAYVFEFRHPSWNTDKVYDLLRRSQIAYCISDLGGQTSPFIITADFVYIRLHGPKKSL